MKDYCNLSVNSFESVDKAVSYLHGLVCVMNRFNKSAQSQAMYELFIAVHYSSWTAKSLFDFLVDMMTLVEDNSPYLKLLYHVRNKVQQNLL